jgi:hypothetical protein
VEFCNHLAHDWRKLGSQVRLDEVFLAGLFLVLMVQLWNEKSKTAWMLMTTATIALATATHLVSTEEGWAVSIKWRSWPYFAPDSCGRSIRDGGHACSSGVLSSSGSGASGSGEFYLDPLGITYCGGVLMNTFVTLANHGLMPVIGPHGTPISVWVKANSASHFLFFCDNCAEASVSTISSF